MRKQQRNTKQRHQDQRHAPAVLVRGTLFAPTDDRDQPGQGFTHKEGDVVSIASPLLGALKNRVTGSHQAPTWTFGVSALMLNLARRGLLGAV